MNKNSLKQRPPVPKPPVQTKAKVSLLRNLAPELYDRLRQDLMEACLAVTETALTAQRYRIRRRIFDTLLKRRIYHRFGSSQFSGMILICILGKECRRDRAGLISARTKEVLRARRASGLPACRTVERPRQKQVGQAPSGNRGAARQRVPPEVHREALQFFACQPRKLAEEAPNQETEAVKSYGGFGTFEPLGPSVGEHCTEGVSRQRLRHERRTHEGSRVGLF